MKHKYVRHSALGFALFPADTELAHSDIAYMMRHKAGGGEIVSAGFVWITPNTVIIEGRSESLNVGPASDDASALKEQLGCFRR